MDIAHILKNKSTDSVSIEVEIYREGDKAFLFIAQNGGTGYTYEVHDDEDLMKHISNYICNNALLVPIDLLNTGSCYYSRGNTDCSKWQKDRVNKQLDYCGNCTRYWNCHNVTVLNDRLQELDNESEEN